MEGRTTMIPQEGQLLVSISDMSMMKDIKKAIGMLKGVGNVTVPRRKRISAYERSLQELAEGKLPEKYLPHQLHGDRQGQWECHIQPNWLLI